MSEATFREARLAPQPVDLVIEGGGAKAVAVAGAVDELRAAGYTFERIIGCSSGSLAGALLAALKHSGESLDRFSELVTSFDFSKILDAGPIASKFGPLSKLAIPYRLLRYGGMHPGRYMNSWIAGVMKDLGTETFGDLRRDDAPYADEDITHRYGFVTLTTDLSQRRMAVFPWDAEDYGLDPDEISVADAVHASAALPGVFQPVEITGKRGTVTFADGGLVSNFPIKLLANNEEREADWPTIGINMTPRTQGKQQLKSVRRPIPQLRALGQVVLEGRETRRIDDPEIGRNVIVIDASPYTPVSFNLDSDDNEELMDRGREAVRDWLEGDDATGTVPE